MLMICHTRFLSSNVMHIGGNIEYLSKIMILVPLIMQQELLDLSDKIGYVGSGLQEQEISSYIRKFNISNPLLTRHKDWNCSICQVCFATLPFIFFSSKIFVIMIIIICCVDAGESGKK